MDGPRKMSDTQPDVVVEVDLGFSPEPAIALPVLVQSDTTTLLGFNAIRPLGDGARTGPVGVAILSFDVCLLARFGHPNDEALSGHPLWVNGLRHYRTHEVVNSSWAAETDAVNRLAFPAHAEFSVRHFVVTFIDSTFECLAQDIAAELIESPDRPIHSYLTERLLP